MPGVELKSANRRLLEEAAIAEVYRTWADGTDHPRDSARKFRDIYAAVGKNRSGEPVSNRAAAFVEMFNAMRLFADSAGRALDLLRETDKSPGGIVRPLDLFETYRNFLETAWFSGEVSPAFAGIHVNTAIHQAETRLGRPIVRNMLLSASLFARPKGFRPPGPIATMLASLWKSFSGIRAEGLAFDDSTIRGVIARGGAFNRSTWNNSQIEDSDYTGSRMDDAQFGRGTRLKNVKFDRAFMGGASFRTSSEERAAPPEMNEREPSLDALMGGNVEGVEILELADFPVGDPSAVEDDIVEGVLDEDAVGDGEGHDTAPMRTIGIATTAVQMKVLGDEIAMEASRGEENEAPQNAADEDAAENAATVPEMTAFTDNTLPDAAGQPSPAASKDIPGGDVTTLKVAIDEELVRGEEHHVEDGHSARGTVSEATNYGDFQPRPSMIEAISGLGPRLKGDVAPKTLHDLETARTFLLNPSFKGTVAPRIDFSNAYIENGRFNMAVMPRANFDGSIIMGADFRDADLAGATFHGAVMSGTIRFSEKTKITLEQLMQTKGAEIAIAEWHRVFGKTDKNDGPRNGGFTPHSTSQNGMGPRPFPVDGVQYGITPPALANSMNAGWSAAASAVDMSTRPAPNISALLSNIGPGMFSMPLMHSSPGVLVR